ncbi:MAG: hypothetical protein ACREU3_05735 [Steroidobacteraceae bacterium]
MAVAPPERICAIVAAQHRRWWRDRQQVAVSVVKGGLDVPNENAEDISVIASAAISVLLEI